MVYFKARHLKSEVITHNSIFNTKLFVSIKHSFTVRMKESFDLNTAMLKQCSIQPERVLHCKAMRGVAFTMKVWCKTITILLIQMNACPVIPVLPNDQN